MDLARGPAELARISDLWNADLRELARLRAQVAALTAALRAIIYASDQCQGHRHCGHSMEPWTEARRLTALDAAAGGA